MAYLDIQGQKVYFVDEGEGEAIVIVHGTPTHSSEYRAVINELSKEFRCIAIDHLGFGNSDKPSDGDYSLTAHQARFAALLDHLHLKEFHLLVHDFGGVIGIPVALKMKAQFSVQTVTILNSWLWPLVETEPQMKKQKWLVTSGVFPFVYRYFNFSAKVLMKMAWGKRKPLAVARHREYIKQFPTPRHREGTIGFLRALFSFEDPSWNLSSEISALKTKHVQIIWGKSDPLISLRSLDRWRQCLPNAKVVELEDVGHFVAEEAPEEVTTHLRSLVRSLARSPIPSPVRSPGRSHVKTTYDQ